MESKIKLSSSAVKEAYQASVGNRLSINHFVSRFSVDTAIDPDRYMEQTKERMLRAMAEAIREKMPLSPSPYQMDDEHGTMIRGKLYVFTEVELIQLLNRLEQEVIKEHQPKTVWGD
jgi:hypothetical protein